MWPFFLPHFQIDKREQGADNERSRERARFRERRMEREPEMETKVVVPTAEVEAMERETEMETDGGGGVAVEGGNGGCGVEAVEGGGDGAVEVQAMVAEEKQAAEVVEEAPAEVAAADQSEAEVVVLEVTTHALLPRKRRCMEVSHVPTPLDGNNVTSSRSLTNTLNKMANEERGSRTMTQDTLHRLRERGYYYGFRRHPDDNDVLSDLFLAHPDGIRLLRRFHYVIILDNTYKTNAYEIPLCEVVGFTPSGHNYCIGYAFMSYENEDTYAWVLRQLQILLGNVQPQAIITDQELGLLAALNVVFPNVQHLLCWGHVTRRCEEAALKITKNLSHARIFKNNCWGLFQSRSEESFNRRRRALHAAWHPFPGVVAYLDAVWLPYSRNIVRCYVDNVFHLGTYTTNRVEGQYKVLKEALHSSTGDFCIVIDAIHRVNDCQLHELQTALEIDRFKWPTRSHTVNLFDKVKTLISKKCFDYLYKLWEDVVNQNIPPECTDRHWRVCYGIPCVHEIQAYVSSGTPIPVEDIHPFWMDLSWTDIDDTPLPYELSSSSHNVCDDDLHPPSSSSVRSKGSPRGSRNACRTNPLRYEEFRANFDREEARAARHRPQAATARRGSDDVFGGFNWGRNNVDPFMFGHIQCVRDTIGDGHCGYRALASLISPIGESAFPELKALLCNHLEDHADHYVGCYMGGYTMQQFVDNQRWAGPVHGDRRRWIELLIMGLVFATVYQIPLVVLAWHHPFTCLPMSSPTPGNNPQSATLGLACIGNEDHFAAVWLRPNAPIPPPAPEWVAHHQPSVEGWDAPFQAQFDRFRALRVDSGRPLHFV